MKEERIYRMERITDNLPAGVTERFKLVVGDNQRDQIVTAYAPAAQPHAEYPADLPFLPNAASYVTIHPNNEVPPGARWLITDGSGADATAKVIAHARGNGWTDPSPDDAQVATIKRSVQNRPEIQTTYLRKGNILRAIVAMSVDGQTILQMLDSPDA
jgi:hypothetical protein